MYYCGYLVIFTYNYCCTIKDKIISNTLKISGKDL